MNKATPYLLIGGGITVGVAAWLGVRKSNATTDAIKRAIENVPDEDGARPSMTFKARTTGYWPYAATAAERKMEGGATDRRGRPIITLEQHQSNPSKYPYISVAGDYTIFPDGQCLALDEFPGLVFRVVDTGGHFFGAKKIYRMAGAEPLDLAVDSSKTKVPTTAVATIFPGDSFAKKGLTEVATFKFKDQTVAGTGIVEGRTSEDHEALARAVESELGSRPVEEQVAAAWAIRNRADGLGRTVASALAPRGCYGPLDVSGGCASTRRAPSPTSRAVADMVLGADSAADPTGGAVDFWVPGLQATMHLLGAAHRAAVAGGDDATARRLARYASYGSIADVRADQARRGLGVVGAVGAVELLGRC